MKVKIDSRGRITIPEAIRETLGFIDEANLEVEGNKIVLSKELDLIKAIEDIMKDIYTCQEKLECIDILSDAKKKIEKVEE